MSTFELVIRTIGSTAAAILAVAMARMPAAPIMGRVCGALLCLGVAIYLPCSASSMACAATAAIPLGLLASGIPFFFWGWSRAVMDDGFRLTPVPLMAGIVLTIAPILVTTLAHARFAGWGVVAHSLLGIAFVAAALAEVLRSWRQDLIEARRRLRLALLVVSGGYAATVLAVELFLQNTPAAGALQLLNATLLAALLLGIAMGVLSASDSLRIAFGWSQTPEPRGPSATQPASVTTRDADEELVAKLHAHMTGKAMYRDATLSIAQLASTIGVQEKRLREVINRRLGHKNFPGYVNAFRLEEVRLRLVDPTSSHIPILTLALDAGFGSIVAFNRAFKDKFATTPSEYRASRVAG